MPQTLMDEVIQIFRSIGPQSRNSMMIRMAAERLRAQGKAVETNRAVTYTRRGYRTVGRIDMSVVDRGITVAVEVDRATPRRDSLAKLRASDAAFKVAVLSSPHAHPPERLFGIDAIVVLGTMEVGDAARESDRGASPSSFAAFDRQQRIERRSDLRRSGRTPAKEQYVYRVQPEVIAIPPWAYTKRVPELDVTADCVWLKSRQLADRLAKMDREENGHPDLMRVQAKRCQGCGLLKLNLLAQHRAKLDESAFDGRLLPCGPECITRRRQQKGQI
jgi:hypothetical protein